MKFCMGITKGTWQCPAINKYKYQNSNFLSLPLSTTTTFLIVTAVDFLYGFG